MASEVVTFADLARFHRDVIVPDIKRIVREEVAEQVGVVATEVDSLRHDMLTHFDAVYTRLDSIAVEQTALKGGLRRLEDRVTRLERKIS